MVKKYKKRPLEVEAVQCTFFNRSEWWTDLEKMCRDVGIMPIFEDESDSGYKSYDYPRITFSCDTYNAGRQPILSPIQDGDYLVKGIDGSVYPVKKDTFNKTYTEVSTESGVITW